MKEFMRRLVRALFLFWNEPDEDQINNGIQKAFGYKTDVDYSVSNNNIVATGDVDSAATFYIDSSGNLHQVGGDSDFKVENNTLYEVE